MIGSHNSFTYLKPSNLIFNLFKRYWKCQNIDLNKQYKLGVRYFDIRVFFNKRNHWQLCHGLVNLKKEFSSIDEICDFFDKNYKEAVYRIIVEKHYSLDQLTYYKSTLLCKNHFQLLEISHKSNIGMIQLASNADKLGEHLSEHTWVLPNVEINGGYHYDNSINVFKNLWRFLKNNIKKNTKEQLSKNQYNIELNRKSRNFVILSDYVDILFNKK